MLDVYCLPTPRADTPILVFSYGGGFYMGVCTLLALVTIIYHNLGSFFATHGSMTIVPDHRLVDSGEIEGTIGVVGISESTGLRGSCWASVRNVLYDEFVAWGHNHVSLMFALGTGQGEGWAEDIVKWIHTCAYRSPSPLATFLILAVFPHLSSYYTRFEDAEAKQNKTLLGIGKRDILRHGEILQGDEVTPVWCLRLGREEDVIRRECNVHSALRAP
ncbi:uncharacterized protein EV420DRAFT_1485182 [Desarmillaria tabescens]|uniref:Uncharacterized protein n=1 Tax=Armillaria tabescens TaxID=1929756 RepID=A0AA39JHB0_ARMTA|nr:uncharacterized protein EV420DRAFT_1485182 [Desarmillaria tabescens]KAK0442761.1 hypothetical protein EV420DRAFT_1485182 [Desarmillaria tabescens]